MTDQEFIDFVKAECKYYGVKCQLKKAKYCRFTSGNCSGSFDHDNRILACAMLRDDWMDILVHEYCHMRQWAEKAEVWIRSIEDKSYEAWDRFTRGKKVDMDIHFSNMRDLELDNERRVVALIKKLKLPIDIKAYTKRANAYVMFYNYMKISGKWCKQANSPYKNKRLLAAMPDKFSLDYTKLPKRLEVIYREEGI